MNRKWIVIGSCLLVAACSRTKPEAAQNKEAKDSSGLITMEEVAQKNVGLQVAPVKVIQLSEYLQVTGTVQPVDSRVSQIRSLARGRLQDVLAKVGDRVRHGQELARIDNLEAGELTSQLASARAELRRTLVLLTLQSKQVERNRRLSEIGAAPIKDYEQSRAEYQALEENARAQEGIVSGLSTRLRRFGVPDTDPNTPVIAAITAPFDGIVIKATASPGAVVDSGNELFTVADISHVWVQAEVYEKDLGRIQIGQPAIIHVDTYPGAPFAGKVTYISDVLDPQTRTAKIRCDVSNSKLLLKLDMFAAVQLPTTFSRQTLAVPVGAIQQLDGKTVVFVRRGATLFEAREITAGKTVNGQVEILSGLRDGEPVATVGAFHLKSIIAGKELGEE
ncbi:MAG TPA: efflux RND transporter periplasmic adaptor subunit [Bryobacteraceae bacterium]|nr:efflux RND transporter periplasmic adaptor subunit [Bryobacteraceae bacterium]HPT25254.1 efflux RND transporter periplasmic adaptor subunit [Bryobacteraceae bacterium]